jgi:transcriptional regulator with XRE-family HTH domain
MQQHACTLDNLARTTTIEGRVTMRKTIQELREARGESRMQLATALGVKTSDVAEWEAGTAEPRISRLRALTEYFGVRDDQINLRPKEASSIADRLAGWS